MDAIKLLDNVLSLVATWEREISNDNFKTYDIIEKRFVSEFPEYETLIKTDNILIHVLKRIEKDGYLTSEGNGGLLEYFRITFDGIVFYQNDGYKAEKERNDAILENERIHTLLLTIGSIAAGLGAMGVFLYDMIKEINSHCPYFFDVLTGYDNFH